MPRFLIKFEIKAAGELEVPGEDEADAAAYVLNQMSWADLLDHIDEASGLCIDSIDEVPK